MATDFQISASHRELVTRVTLFQVPDPSNGQGGGEQAAKDSLFAASWLQKPKIVEPTEIDGVEVYHIAGESTVAASSRSSAPPSTARRFGSGST